MSGYDQALQNLSAARDAVPGALVQEVLAALRDVARHLADAGVTRYDGLLSQADSDGGTALSACEEIARGLDDDIARTHQLMSG
ncbi:hypothetical protein [Allokutzneria sp. NRRL B-24872]|uniref:hypothetical protein n=1 Tax=Allokutzneria sp. NRRL B-24872 TaxID=1137961 RepID=UPI000A3AC1D7|nr:hypothetical protein [Allokutzneria sp. NRRL B-24872]